MKRILFITALILGSCGYAQIPGYKGKKFVVSGEYLTFTSLLEYNKNFGKGITSLRSISGVTCDYVISRSVSFGVGVNFYKTGLLHESYVKEFYGPDTYDYTSYSTNTFYHLSGKEINVYWKFFSYR
jgi:hypothetical protein